MILCMYNTYRCILTDLSRLTKTEQAAMLMGIISRDNPCCMSMNNCDNNGILVTNGIDIGCL